MRKIIYLNEVIKERQELEKQRLIEEAFLHMQRYKLLKEIFFEDELDEILENIEKGLDS